MANKKGSDLRKAEEMEAEARRISREAERAAERAATRPSGSITNPIDVDQEGPFTPGPVDNPTVEDKSVMAERHPEFFQTPVEKVEEEEAKNYATFNYQMSYLHVGPNQQSRVVKILNRDDRLELLGEDEKGWTHVKDMTKPQVEGYVKTAFLKGD